MSKLWSIHIPGPVEHYAAPSEEAARTMADKHNAAMAEYFTRKPSALEFGPDVQSCTAVVAEWPFELEQHEEEIAEFDYAAWGLDVPNRDELTIDMFDGVTP